jgi:ribosome maturation factor RimP
MVDDLTALLQPVLEGVGLELVDAEFRSGVLLVTVDRPGGIDLDGLTEANRAVSRVLDQEDPIPSRYTLEVSSPGVERRLRTPAHFSRAIGETITVKTRPQVAGERRLQGRLTGADEDGFEVTVDGDDHPTRLSYTDVDRVRTVFVWGPAPRPGGGGANRRARTSRPTTEKRKQVTNR